MDYFKQDLFRKELIPVKVLMFLIYGGQATLYPYFTVHLKSLGVGIRQTAIIFAVQPVIALLVAPAVGMAADKIGNFRLIFCFFLSFSAVTANLLLFVPPVIQPEKHLHFNLKCDSQAKITIELNKATSCAIKSELNSTYSTMKFQCQHSCDLDNQSFFPVSLKEKGKDCSGLCGKGQKDKCIHINESSRVELFLNVHNFSDSHTTEIKEDSYWITYNNATYDSFQCSCSGCNVNCTFVSQNQVTDCMDFPPSEEYGATFWTYLGIRLVVTLGIGLVNGLFDAASMTIIQELNADVGFQRVWSTVAMCILAPVSGKFVDTFGDFRPCFFMYGILYVIAAITSLKLDLSMKLPSENPVKNLAKLMKNPEVLLLLMQIAVLGIFWGFLENFLFWFLESELGSNNLIMGLTVTVGSGTGLFMALIATWCTRKLGYVNVIIVAFAAYTVRFLGYSYSKDAFTCLIFEMMENFTVTLLTVGVTLYCTELASVEMLTTIMTLWNGLHIISGRAFGSLLGGFIVNNYGFRQTFRIFACISCSFGFFYALMYIIWLRKWRKDHKKELEENRRRNISSLSEAKEDETMKHETFPSFSLHCSSDSPAILLFIPDTPHFEFRRRAVSCVPRTTSNSFRSLRRIPRYAASFSEDRTLQRPLSVVMEYPEDFKQSNFSSSTTEDCGSNNKNEMITKF